MANENIYLKPFILGILSGFLILLMYVLVVYGSTAIFSTGDHAGKVAIPDPMGGTLTPTPAREPFEMIIVLLFFIYILIPILMIVLGSISLWSTPINRLALSQLLIISAIPGIVSMLVFQSILGSYYFIMVASPYNQSMQSFWLSMVSYMTIGLICSTAGGVVYGLMSGRLEKKA